ncbi:SGNH/GDSL hydrolase family protein [Mycobacterium sp. OTB74]|uniref:SGNH/GDSL hydrolase family protein n=1 Tax=Mycobacterium sp. OTB74 TaxID=1853452 RepID=UPI002473F556|nr:SGNH/GDSL hydrolase family protein [Mycobacterium sp. OTB74]
MRAPRVGDVAAVVLAVCLVGGLGYVLRPQHTATVAPNLAAAPISRPGSTDEPRKTMLFIGDSYVSGTGLDETSFGCMTAARMGWYCKVAAGPGTGYISGGPANRFELEDIGESTSFNERVPGLAMQYKPDIVVLDGGRNDQFASTRAVYDAMVSLISDVRRTWPAATVVVIRPRILSRPADDLGFDDAFFDRLRAEDITQHMVVVSDPIRRLIDTDTSSDVGNDGIHPSRQGEFALSSAFFDSLVEHGFVPAR